MKMLYFLHFPISKQMIFSVSSDFIKTQNRTTTKKPSQTEGLKKYIINCDLPVENY